MWLLLISNVYKNLYFCGSLISSMRQRCQTKTKRVKANLNLKGFSFFYKYCKGCIKTPLKGIPLKLKLSESCCIG